MDKQAGNSDVVVGSEKSNEVDAPDVRAELIALIEQAQEIAPSLLTCSYVLSPIQVAWIIGRHRAQQAQRLNESEVPLAFMSAFLKWNGHHTQAEISAEWKSFGGLCGTFFREGQLAVCDAGALAIQPTVDDVLAELRADLRELQNNLEAFGEYSQETARVALDGAVDALDEVAEKYATPRQEGSEVPA
jgi:hypothetical protein